jgi:co-chaperonin GroES (HSP10)
MSANPATQDRSLDEAFPAIEPGVEPLGSRVLVQIRLPRRKTKGGIILTDDTADTDQDNTQAAKIISMGPLAFCNRETGKPWVEGAWVEIGDFVRVPKYGGDRFSVPIENPITAGEKVWFAVFNDLDLTGKFTVNPIEHKAYI